MENFGLQYRNLMILRKDSCDENLCLYAGEIYQSLDSMLTNTFSRGILRYDLDTADSLSHSERFISICGGLRSMATGFYNQKVTRSAT